MSDRELRLRILGDSSSAENALKKVEGATQRLDPASKVANKSLGDLTSTLTSRLGPAGGAAKDALDKLGVGAISSGGLLGTAVVGGAAAAGAALISFGAKSVSAFADATAKVREFQRVSGASAEDSSKLVFAMHELGIDSDTAAGAVFRLTRNVAEHADKLKADGVEIAKNAQGNTDIAGTLLNVSDAYNKTQDPAQKAKIVFDAFGKSGAAMIPILQRGRDGLVELYREAAKDHQVFNDADLEKGRQFTLATNQLEAAFKGVEIEVGQALVPKITEALHGVTSLVGEADQLAHTKLGGPFKEVGDALGYISKSTGALNPLNDIRLASDVLGGNFHKSLTDVVPLVGLFWHESDHLSASQKQAADALKRTQDAVVDEKAALQAVTDTQQRAAQVALDHMVATGRLTQAQLDSNTALHHQSDGTLDYMATLKELDPALAKQVDAQARVDAGLGDARSAFQRASDAASDYQQKVDQLLTPLLNADQANVRWHQELDQLRAALQANGNTIDLNTKAGQDNQNQIIATTEAGDAYIQKLIAEGATQDRVNAAKAEVIAKLQELERQYPAAAAQINAYIAQVQAIPPTAGTTVTANVDQAMAAVGALEAKIAQMRGQSNQPILNIGGGQVGVSVGGARLQASGGYWPARSGGYLVNLAEGGADEAVLTAADPAGGIRLFSQLYKIPQYASGGMVRSTASLAATSAVGPWVGDVAGLREDIADLADAHRDMAKAVAALASRPVELKMDSKVIAKAVGSDVSTIMYQKRLARSRQ